MLSGFISLSFIIRYCNGEGMNYEFNNSGGKKLEPRKPLEEADIMGHNK
jgi:hypothetical protein